MKNSLEFFVERKKSSQKKVKFGKKDDHIMRKLFSIQEGESKKYTNDLKNSRIIISTMI